MSTHVLAQRAAVCALVTGAGVLAACTSSATGRPPHDASSPRSHASGASAPAAARVFRSPHFSYTVALPAGWSAQAAQRWDGPGAHSLGNGGVDVFRGPPYVRAWVFAAPAQASLAASATTTARAAAPLPCPAVPQTDEEVTIGGAPAPLIGMRCPLQGGVLMLTAITAHGQQALAFVFEDSSGEKAAEQADRIAFRQFLAGMRFSDQARLG